MALRKILMVTAMTALTACQSTPNSRSKASSEIVQAKSTDRLSARVMEFGECGLFVWQIDPAPKLVLFSQEESGAVDWWSEETGEIQLPRLSARGFESQGQSPMQVFELPDGSALKLDLRNPGVVDNGTRYKSGTLTLPASGNLEKIMPVTGMAACNLNPVTADYTVKTIR